MTFRNHQIVGFIRAALPDPANRPLILNGGRASCSWPSTPSHHPKGNPTQPLSGEQPTTLHIYALPSQGKQSKYTTHPTAVAIKPSKKVACHVPPSARSATGLAVLFQFREHVTFPSNTPPLSMLGCDSVCSGLLRWDAHLLLRGGGGTKQMKRG